MKRSLSLLTCLVLLTTASAALAQDAPAPKSSPVSTTTAVRQAPQTDPSQPQTFDLAFPGGTIAQYAEAIRKATGGAANIVINPEAADFPVPALSISAVDVRSAVNILQDRSSNPRSGRWIGIEEISTGRSDARLVFVINAYDRVTSSRRHQPPTESSCVWSLSPVIDNGKKLEDVLSAIEAALSMFPEDEPKPQVRLHKETGLLIACGDSAKLAAVNAVLKALSPPQPPGASDYDALRADVQELREQVQKLQAQSPSPARSR